MRKIRNSLFVSFYAFILPASFMEAANVPREANRLLAEARQDLDFGRIERAVQKSRNGLALLDPEDVDHRGPWAHGYTTLAYSLAWIGAGTAKGRKRNDYYTSAFQAIEKGALRDESGESPLKKQWPDLYARLMETRGVIYDSLSVDPQMESADATKYWEMALEDWNEALQTARNPLASARVHIAMSFGFHDRATQTSQSALYLQGIRHAEEALRLSDGVPAGQVIYARALWAHCESFGSDAAPRIHSTEDPIFRQLKREMETASAIIQAELPDSAISHNVTQYSVQFDNAERKERINQVMDIMGILLSWSGNSGNSSDAEKVWMYQTDRNRQAISAGERIPYPQAGH